MLYCCQEVCIKFENHTTSGLFGSPDYTLTVCSEDGTDSPVYYYYIALQSAGSGSERYHVGLVQSEECRSSATSLHKKPSFLEWMEAINQ